MKMTDPVIHFRFHFVLFSSHRLDSAENSPSSLLHSDEIFLMMEICVYLSRTAVSSVDLTCFSNMMMTMMMKIEMIEVLLLLLLEDLQYVDDIVVRVDASPEIDEAPPADQPALALNQLAVIDVVISTRVECSHRCGH